MSYRTLERVKQYGVEVRGTEGAPAAPARDERRKGMFVVSLDFELYWGVRDILKLSQCQEKLLAARAGIPALLDLFAEYEIHATWATVGMLFPQSKKDLIRSMPSRLPHYVRPELSPYREIDSLGFDEASDPCRYANELIQTIASTPHQEIGTHTFSHFYCLEAGPDAASFRDDLTAAICVARQSGFEIDSLVFPRNQVNADYLSVCAELGISAYRGTAAGWLYASRKHEDESLLRRGLRLIDACVNLSGHNTHDLQEVCGTPVNLPASRYLWMYSRFLSPLEPLRLRRIENEMSNAARQGRLYHLWFHPEDIGVNLGRSLAFLRRVFECFARIREKGEIESLNMREAAQRFTEET